MPLAKLGIKIPERVWIGELSREFDDAEFEILTAFPKETGGAALAEVTAPDPGAVVHRMAQYEEVLTLDVIQKTSDTALIQFETSDPFLLLPVRKAGTPLELPFVIHDGTADWEITASRDRLSTLADQLREFDISFDVRSVTNRVETTQLLTDKQRSLVEFAVCKGYYDTPRDITLTELAGEFGVAKSTCSETLHRAEAEIIKHFVGDIDPI